MLELKAALISLGFNVEAQRLAADEFSNIQVPAIFLVSAEEEKTETAANPAVGHYFLWWPIDKENVQIVDYPRSYRIFSKKDWIARLHKDNVRDLPVLLCGRQGQQMKDMLSTVEASGGSDKGEAL